MGKKKAKVRNHHAKVHPVVLSPIEVKQAWTEANPPAEVSAVPELQPYVEPESPARKRGFWEWLTGSR